MKSLFVFLFTLIGLSVMGQGSSYNSMVATGAVIPTDADMSTYSTAVTTASGSLTSSQIRALNRFANVAKTTGFWTYIDELYVPLGGQASCLIKIKTHPSVSGGFTNLDVSAGTAMVAGNYNIANGLIWKTGNVIKTRCLKSYLAYNNLLISCLSVATAKTDGTMLFGAGNSTSAPTTSLGFGFQPNLKFFPYLNTTQFGNPIDQINYPNTEHVNVGLYTTNILPVSGTRYTKTHIINTTYTGNRDEDNTTSTWTVTPSDEIIFTPASADQTLSLYVLGRGMPANLLAIYQNTLLTLHNELGRNDIMPTRDTDKVLFVGDSYGEGTGIVDGTPAYPTYIYRLLNPAMPLFNTDCVAGTTIDFFTSLYDGNKFNYKNKFQGNTANNNYLVLELGNNDLGAGIGAVSAKSKLDALCTRFVDAGWKILYVLPVPSVNWSGSGSYTSNFNAAVTDYINLIKADVRYSNGTLAFGYVEPALETQLSNPNDALYFGDGLHLTGLGMRIYSSLIANKFMSVFRIGKTSSTINLANYTIADGFVKRFGNINGSNTEVGNKTWATNNSNLITNNRKELSCVVAGTSFATISHSTTGSVGMSITGLQVSNSPDDFPILLFKYQDASNYMYGRMRQNTTSTNILDVVQVVAGVSTNVGYGTYNGSVCDYMQVDYTATSATVTISGTSSIASTVAVPAALQSNTGIGLGIISNGSGSVSKVANFSAK
jgi:hypothetical protein